MEGAIGVDLGTTKTVVVLSDASLVLTATGGISRPSLVTFVGRTRLVGEEAAAQASSDNTVGVNFDLVGQSLEAATASPLSVHRKSKLTANAAGRPCVSVNYNDEQIDMDVASICGMFLAAQDKRICEVGGSGKDLAFCVPPNSSSDVGRTIREAAAIAGIGAERVHIVSKIDAMRLTYARKLQALRPVEIGNLKDKKVLMVEMGAAYSTAVLLSISGAEEPVPMVVAYQHDSQLGAAHFDLELFTYFSEVCVTKFKGEPVVPGSKRGHRLLSGCERLRKLLSQLGEGSVQVENMTDSGDVQLSLRRDELSGLCSGQLGRFKQLLLGVLEKAGVSAADVFAVEVLGGGSRMQVVQQVLSEVFGSDMPLGAKFDDASVALGAAIFVNNAKAAQPAAAGSEGSEKDESSSSSSSSSSSNCSSSAFPALGEKDLDALRAREESMQKQDAEISQVLAVRNSLEAFLLDMRGAPRRNFGGSIDSGKLNALLDDIENWLWDNQDAGLAELEAKNSKLRAEVGVLCSAYFEAVEKDRVEVERKLEADAAAAAAERAAEGGDDDDHDNRKLRYPDRMRLAVKNKDEGTELFKGAVSAQQFRTAAARYTKSLTHCNKFFDMSPEQTKEVTAMKVTLYLNLASCYLKLENADSALNNCVHAIDLDGTNAKAYFRRSMAYEAKKDWEKALEDIKKAQTLVETEDKALTLAAKRIKQEISREKDKAKGVWGKALGGL